MTYATSFYFYQKIMIVFREYIIVFSVFVSHGVVQANNCDNEDFERANMTCENEDVCIIGFDELKMKSNYRNMSYRYSDTERVTLNCHVNRIIFIKNCGTIPNDAIIKIRWLKGQHPVSNETNCSNLIKDIDLSLDTNNTEFFCHAFDERYGCFKKVPIKFLYDPKELRGIETHNKTHTDKWILAAGLLALIFVIVVIAATLVVLKLKKRSKDSNDKSFLEPRGLRDKSSEQKSQVQSDQNTITTDEDYSNLYPNITSEENYYGSPYLVKYSQSKRFRNSHIEPQAEPKNIENYSNTREHIYDEPLTYNNVAKNTGTMHHNVNEFTGTYLNYNNINKSSNNIEHVNFKDNMAVRYCNLST